MFCPNCGSELEYGDMFCSYCGTNIEHSREAEVGKKLCPECGTELKGEERFCGFCGADIESIEKVKVEKRFCPVCGGELVYGTRFCNSCGARISEPSIKKAGTGARFGSYLIDSIILGILGFTVGFVSAIAFLDVVDELEPILNLLGILISMGYFTYFFGTGQTPGMSAMNIKLCRTDGTYPIGPAKGFLRWIGMIISGLAIGLGFLWILIDKNKQGWHDKIAGTYVVSE